MMAQGELVFAPLGGIGEIGMNLSIYGVGDARGRKWLMVDCGVSFAAEEHLPGDRPDPAGYPLSDRGTAQHRRAGAHPRPRRPYGRADRFVAAAQGAALRHAICGGLVRSTPAVRARRTRNSGQCRAARRSYRARTVRGRFHQCRAFDPGIERARHPHAARHGAAYRRLEDRSHPAASARRPIRPSSPRSAIRACWR